MGKVDIKAMVEAAGSDRLPDAVPIVCAPGDVAITNRQCVHGSFANTSPDPRVTINFGFHRRASVLGVESGGVHNAVAVYDEERIDERSKAIVWGIDARAQRFPYEDRYVYEPFAGHEDEYRYGRRTRSSSCATTTATTSASERRGRTADAVSSWPWMVTVRPRRPRSFQICDC